MKYNPIGTVIIKAVKNRSVFRVDANELSFLEESKQRENQNLYSHFQLVLCPQRRRWKPCPCLGSSGQRKKSRVKDAKLEDPKDPENTQEISFRSSVRGSVKV